MKTAALLVALLALSSCNAINVMRAVDVAVLVDDLADAAGSGHQNAPAPNPDREEAP